MTRTLRPLLLLLIVAMLGLVWPADAAAQRGAVHSGRAGVAVARPAAGPYHGGYGYRAPYYPARYYRPYYYPYYPSYGWGVGFGFGVGWGGGWSASFGVYGYPYGYAYGYPYRYAYPYPYAVPYPYAYPGPYAYPYAGATVVHVAPRTAANSPEQPPYDDQQPAGPARSGVQSDFATLSLRVSPANAEILIDGQPWDHANADSRFSIDLGAGRHQLEIRSEGFGSYVRTVDLARGQTVTLNIALTPRGPVPASMVSAARPLALARR